MDQILRRCPGPCAHSGYLKGEGLKVMLIWGNDEVETLITTNQGMFLL